MTDEAADWSPKRLSEMVGQAQAVQRLKPLVELSRERAEPLPHILLIGAEGMGKRALAAVLASEMSAAIVTMAGPSLERGGDLMGILTNLAERDVLFIDEIHRLPRAIEELLYPAMEDALNPFVNFVIEGSTMKIPLRPFTLIGAAGKGAEVRPKLRALFPVTVVLQPYSEAELSDIAHVFARARGLSLSPGAAALIGRSSGGSLRKVRSALQLAGRPGAMEVSEADASTALAILGHQVDGALSVPADLMQLSGTEFEVCVTGLLQRIGFRTELTRATGDGGLTSLPTWTGPSLVAGTWFSVSGSLTRRSSGPRWCASSTARSSPTGVQSRASSSRPPASALRPESSFGISRLS